MEVIKNTVSLYPQRSPSSSPLSPQLAHTLSQASVSAPPKVSETPSASNMTKSSTRTPLPKLLADLPPIPTFDPTRLNDSPSRYKGSRPSLSRHRTTDTLRASNRSPTSPSSSSGGSIRSSRHVTPSPRSASAKNGLLYPPHGDNRKKAASLDDLSLPNLPASSLTSLAPPDLASLLPSSISVMSHRKYSNRVSQYGVRRWHALMELVATEEGYVKDLKILVKIYLDQLSTVGVLEHGARAEIARNADALLTQHRTFVRKLQKILDDEGIKRIDSTRESSMILAEPQLERAIREVSKLFIEEANAFRLYESFCAGHSQALDVIRQVQALPEWDMYEKRCALIVATEGDEVLKSPDPILSRRHSTDVAKLSEFEILPKASRLTMADFLIKPIQRICKYPLMLGQLQPDSNFHAMRIAGRKSLEQQIENRALEVMKGVAAKVDDARKKMDIAIKSKLIVERVPEKALPELTSLGDCWLAGSLDVLYHHETLAPLSTPVKIKYLGAFLYAGWFLLVKVLKHKVYEPKYWFPLSLVQIIDIPENDALLPASFRISSGEHHFELAAACLQEKLLWITSLKEARTKFPLELQSCHLPSSLDDPPKTPSVIQSHSKRPSRKATDPPPTLNDVLTITPRRKSSLSALEEWGIAHLGTTEEPSGILPASASAPAVAPGPLRNLLEGEVSTVLIRRASANHRTMVDRGLHDVFSDLCIAVRVTAQMKEPLFQPPKLTASSTSTITAKNVMTKRNSILLRRQRRSTDAADLEPPSTTPSPMSSVASKFALTRNKSAHTIGSLKELRRRTLAVPSFGLFEEKDEINAGQPASRPSTAGSSNTSSQPTTPTVGVFSDATSDAEGLMLQSKRRRKRASAIEDDLHKKGVSDYPVRFDGSHVARAVHLDVTKDLPPTPKLLRRRTLMSPLGFRRGDNDFSDSSLPTETKRPYTLYSIGQGLTNIEPEEHNHSVSKSSLNPSSLIRKSLNSIVSKRNKSTPNYIANLFNRSTVSVVHDSSSSTSHSRAFSEPPSTPPKRPSASTPALQEAITAWELVSTSNTPKRPDSNSANDFLIPPVPPLPLSISQPSSLQRSKSSLRKKSSQFFHHLNRLSQINPRDP